MKNNNYYDKYWKGKISDGMLDTPPEWSSANLKWHHDFFKKFIGKKVLDVGAGDGTFLNYITCRESKIKTAVASELSSEAIAIGKQKYKELDFKMENLEDLGFPDKFFDTVFAIEVVEHLLDIPRAFSEISRVLKSGGYLCITTTDFNFLKKIIISGLFWNKFFYPTNPHIRFFTKQTLSSIAEKNNLRLVSYKWNKSYFGIMPKGQMVVFKKK